MLFPSSFFSSTLFLDVLHLIFCTYILILSILLIHVEVGVNSLSFQILLVFLANLLFYNFLLVLLNDTYKLLQYFQDERLRLIFQKRLQFLLIYYLSLVSSLLKVTFVVIYKIVSYAF